MIRFLNRKLSAFQINPVKLYSMLALAVLAAGSTGFLSSIAQDILDSLDNNVRFAEAYGGSDSCTYNVIENIDPSLTESYTVLQSPTLSDISQTNDFQQINLPFDFRVGGKIYNSLYTGIRTEERGFLASEIALSFDTNADQSPQDYIDFDLGNPLSTLVRYESPRGAYGEPGTDPDFTENYKLSGPMRYQTIGQSPRRQFVMEWQTQVSDMIPRASDDSFFVRSSGPVLFDVTNNDYNHSGNSTTIQIVNQPSLGSATVVNNQIQYTPDTSEENTSTQIEYILVDSITGLNSQIAYIDIYLNYMHLRDEEVRSTDSSGSIDVLTNDYIYFNDSVQLSITSTTPGLSAQLGPNNTIEYVNDLALPFAYINYQVMDSRGFVESKFVSLDFSANLTNYAEDEVDEFNLQVINEVLSDNFMRAAATKNLVINKPEILGIDSNQVSLSFDGQQSYEDQYFEAIINGDSVEITSKDNFGVTSSGYQGLPLDITLSSVINPGYTVTYRVNLEMIAVPEMKAVHQVVMDEYNGNIKFGQVGQGFHLDTNSYEQRDVRSFSNDWVVSDLEDPTESGSNVASLYYEAQYELSARNLNSQDFNIVSLLELQAINCYPTGIEDYFTVQGNRTTNLNLVENDLDFEYSRDPQASPLKAVEADFNIFYGPGNGTLEVLSDGTVNYTPNPGFFGDDYFAYTLRDYWQGDLEEFGTSEDNPHKQTFIPVNITVQQTTNNAPLANPDSFNLLQNEDILVDVLTNDTDPENDQLSICPNSLTQPQNGSVTIIDNQIAYTPTQGFSGTNSVSYRACDSGLESNSTTVTFIVSASNQPPIGNPDSAQTAEDTPVDINVLSNDTDPENDTLSICANSVSNPANGTVSVINNLIRYTPNPNFNGNDTLTYRVCDSSAQGNQTTVTVTINSVNDTPLAVDDLAETNEDESVEIDVLVNDTDTDNQVLSICQSSLTEPQNGQVQIQNNRIVYTPDPNYYGTDTVSYSACDLSSNSNMATVTIFVLPINDLPNANPDATTTPEDTPVEIDVLANDSDIDNLLAICQGSMSTPSNGSVQMVGGLLEYTPDTDFYGTDSFTYMACDNEEASSEVTVTIVVTPVVDAPVAVSDIAETDEDQTVQIRVLDNDLTSEGGSLAICSDSVTNPTHGLVSIVNQTVEYTPNTNFFGQDSFQYRACETSLSSQPVLVTVTVRPVNDQPLAIPDSASTNEDEEVSINVLNNDLDTEDTVLTICSDSLSQAPNGVVRLQNQTIVYTPAPDYFGNDSFTYRACDSQGIQSQDTLVEVVVNPINDLPLGSPDSLEIQEDTQIDIDVLLNDSDSEDTELSICFDSLSAPANGSATVVNGQIRYIPSLNYYGIETLSYRVCDSDDDQSQDIPVTVRVLPVNDLPVARPDTALTSEDTPVMINLLANDEDTESSALTICSNSLSDPINGRLELQNGQVRYIPNSNYSGSDAFVYRACDSDSGQSQVAQVTITISSINDIPVANPDTATTLEDQSTDISVLSNDTDADGDALSVCQNSLSSPANGNVLIVGTQIRYIPNSDYFGQDSFSYRVCDLFAQSQPVVVSVTVSPVNDNPIAAPDLTSTSIRQAVNIDILANDTDLDGQLNQQSIAIVSQPSLGQASIIDGVIVYTPSPTNTTSNQTDTFSYIVRDLEGGQSNVAQVTVDLIYTNRPPVLLSQTLTTFPGVQVDFAALEENDPDGDGPLTFRLADLPEGLICNVENRIVKCQPDSNTAPGQMVFKVIATDRFGLDSQPVNFVVEVVELNTSTSLRMDLRDSQIVVGSKVNIEVAIANPNLVSLNDVRTTVNVDPQKLKLIQQTIKPGRLQNFTLVDWLTVEAIAQQNSQFQILSDSSFEVRISSLGPGETLYYTFQTEALESGQSTVTAETRAFGQRATESQAQLVAPTQQLSPIQTVIRTGGRLDVIVTIAATLGLLVIALLFRYISKSKLRS